MRKNVGSWKIVIGMLHLLDLYMTLTVISFLCYICFESFILIWERID